MAMQAVVARRIVELVGAVCVGAALATVLRDPDALGIDCRIIIGPQPGPESQEEKT